MSDLTRSARAHLIEQAHQTQSQLRAAHAHAVASVQPLLQALYRELEAERTSLDEDETIPLTWLYQKRRMQHIEQAVYHAMAHFREVTEHLLTTLQHQATAYGTHIAEQQVAALGKRERHAHE